MFWNKRVPKPLNVGKARVQITFTDNSSEVQEIIGDKHTPAKYLARQFMYSALRKDWRITSEDGDKVTFKDARSLEIVALEDYWINV